MNRACCFLALAVCTLAGAGCAQFQEYANENIIAARNKKMALEAWRSVKDAYPIQEPYRKHFKSGFIDGYYDIVSGGNGCPPVLPPKKYWEACYQSPEGHEKIQLWFNGFSEGVMVAKLDGAGMWSEIPTSISDKCEYPEEMVDPEIPPEPGPNETTPPPPAPRNSSDRPRPVEPPVPPRIPQNLQKDSANEAASSFDAKATDGVPTASPVILPVAQ